MPRAGRGVEGVGGGDAVRNSTAEFSVPSAPDRCRRIQGGGMEGVGGGDAVRNSTSAGRKIFLLSPDAADDDGDGEGDGVMLLLMVVLMMVVACW